MCWILRLCVPSAGVGVRSVVIGCRAGAHLVHNTYLVLCRQWDLGCNEGFEALFHALCVTERVVADDEVEAGLEVICREYTIDPTTQQDSHTTHVNTP